MQIRLDRFPGGAHKALTLSYDDGVGQDRRLVALLNQHGMKGTFNLNYGMMHGGGGWKNGSVFIERLQADEIDALYAGHEVAAHGLTHPHLEMLPQPMLRQELLSDRLGLESLVGYPVRGFAYPFGSYSPAVLEMLSACGFAYARTVGTTHRFTLPERPLEWDSTCHHEQNLMENATRFLERNAAGDPSLFYVWGHSYEFDVRNNWELMASFCDTIAGRADVWYATNIEILDYLQAVRGLHYSVDGSILQNPSASDVWVSVEGEAVRIAGGETKRL